MGSTLIQNSKRRSRIYGATALALLFVFSAVPVFAQGVASSTADATASPTAVDASSTPATIAEQRQQLEQQLADLEQQMAEQQKVIDQYQSQGKTLKNEIAQVNAQISQLNLQIKAVQLSLQKVDDEIYQTQLSINQTQNEIDQQKQALAAAVEQIYESDRTSLLTILLQNKRLSDFFGALNNITFLQASVQQSLADITKLREQLLTQQDQLNTERGDVVNLQTIQQNRKSVLASTVSGKQTLLAETRGQESKYQALLAKTQETATQIRSRIFQLIGGGQMSFADAYQLAKLASGATGVRAAFILAILDRESLLGKNVGQCTYQTAMNPKRDTPVFLAILSTLHIDPNSEVAKVSCPNAHGTYGGAMGPAQFIPSTWALYGGYSGKSGQWVYSPADDDIGVITGNKPSNPWTNSDAFAATALFLRDLYNSASCVNYGTQYSYLLPKQELQERCAAAMYYAGSSWWTYRFWYGDAVVQQADKFESDIAVLEKSGD